LGCWRTSPDDEDEREIQTLGHAFLATSGHEVEMPKLKKIQQHL
jgi:hypothetical protein